MNFRTLSALFLLVILSAPAQSAIVWSGETLEFVKEVNVSVNNPDARDMIVPGVEITRGETRGIYNYAAEDFYEHSVSPLGTEWAFDSNINQGQAVRASNWHNLDFRPWEDAHATSGGNPPSTVGKDAVLHLIDADIYLDIRFTSWAIGEGGFSYLRAVAPVLLPGDLTSDGIVDIDDLNLAIDNFTGSGGGFDVTQGDGDTDADNDVDNKDLGFIIGEFTNPDAGLDIAQALAYAGLTTVPEPSTLIVFGLSGSLVSIRRRGRCDLRTTPSKFSD